MRIDTLPIPVMAPEQIGTRIPVLRPRLERRTCWCTLVTLAKNLSTDEDHVEDVRRVIPMSRDMCFLCPETAHCRAHNRCRDDNVLNRWRISCCLKTNVGVMMSSGCATEIRAEPREARLAGVEPTKQLLDRLVLFHRGLLEFADRSRVRSNSPALD